MLNDIADMSESYRDGQENYTEEAGRAKSGRESYAQRHVKQPQQQGDDDNYKRIVEVVVTERIPQVEHKIEGIGIGGCANGRKAKLNVQNDDEEIEADDDERKEEKE